MYGQYLSYGFSLDDHRLIYDHIKPIATLQVNPAVLDWQRHLALEFDSPYRQLPTQTRLVRRLKQPRAKPTVHLNDRTHDVVSPAARGALCVLCASVVSHRPRIQTSWR
jgi:hypothetical protein